MKTKHHKKSIDPQNIMQLHQNLNKTSQSPQQRTTEKIYAIYLICVTVYMLMKETPYKYASFI